MIARVCGKIVEKGNNFLVLEIGGVSYEILLPATVMQRLDGNIAPDGRISLITYHYHQVESSRSTPVLMGFLNEIEKDFFEIFITVSGIGPRAALRALNQPISLIARAIDEADTDFLKSLPGIGQQRAKEIVAKLQNKVGKFGLIQDSHYTKDKKTEEVSRIKDMEEEALNVLMQLQYKKSEAQDMIKRARQRSPASESAEELLNEIYKDRK